MAKLVFGMNQSLDGYGRSDHQKFAPRARAFPSLHRADARPDRQCTASALVLRRCVDGDEDDPAWTPTDATSRAAWRRQPKWVVSRSLKSVGPNATLVSDNIEAVIRGLKGSARRGD